MWRLFKRFPPSLTRLLIYTLATTVDTPSLYTSTSIDVSSSRVGSSSVRQYWRVWLSLALTKAMHNVPQ